MHLAVQNAFPNLSLSAEREFIARVDLAGRSLGWQISQVVTSDDILACKPDMVLATHEFSPKLTQFPTIGVIWSPTSYFEDDPVRMRNILSYDGYLVATPQLRAWVKTFLAQHGKTAPISSFAFLPTAIDLDDKVPPRDPVLFYAGVHWDGRRHGDLFQHLETACPLRIYGKPERWKGKTQNYSGTLPFDGTGVVTAIADCGIALALHTDQHRQGDVPSMRLFEGAAAGAVVIADRLPFTEQHFDDTILWVDVDQPADQVARQIVSHVDWVRQNPDAARQLAMRANRIFVERFDLKAQLEQLPAFLVEVNEAMAFRTVDHDANPPQEAVSVLPRVDVIMRIGSRPAQMIERALASLAAQSYPNICLILVKFRDVDGLDELISRYRKLLVSVRVVEVGDSGYRSTALWAGLAEAQGKYLCNLDDDDRIHPGHIAALVRCLEQAPTQTPLAYTGAIEVQEDDGFWFDQPNFQGDLTERINERRSLRFLDRFSAHRMKKFDNFVNSNAWMARRAALTPDIMRDPMLKVGEDVYLYLMLMRQAAFAFVPFATAEWYWRSRNKDNSMFDSELFGREAKQLAQKLFEHGALDEVPRSLRQNTNVLAKIRNVIRKPSLLLGSYAPGWRRLRQAWRNRLASKR